MAICKIFASAGLVLVLGSAAGAQLALPREGQVYPIAEPDMLEELRTKAATVDWARVIDKDRQKDKLKAFQPGNLVKLPAAQADRAFLVDMTYTLDVDLPDGKGGILYPKGYAFNPLDYAPLRGKLVVIDGSDPRQVQWFAASPLCSDPAVKLLLSGGAYYPLMERFRRPVFYYMQPMAVRLQLEAVPSVIEQSGTHLKVTEIGLGTRQS